MCVDHEQRIGLILYTIIAYPKGKALLKYMTLYYLVLDFVNFNPTPTLHVVHLCWINSTHSAGKKVKEHLAVSHAI